MLSRGQILVDGRPVTRFDHALTAGQTVTVLAHISPRPALPFDILYEDDELIVIDKPAGLLSIATDREQTATAYRTLNDYVSGKKPGSRVHVVHRLDRDTSGILLFAKNRALKLAFQNDWNKLARTRGYVAVAEGVPQRPAATIRSFLYETSTRIVYSGAPGAGGQEAITRYALRAENGRYSFWTWKSTPDGKTRSGCT
jgi:23S rRNA pseudouridine1911/1915/1917 synthase